MKSYKEVSPEEMQRLVEEAHQKTQGAQAATTGPDKLDPQVAELLKAVEGELRRFHKRILELEIFVGPFQQLFAKMFNEEVDKKLGRDKAGQFMAEAKCAEASPMQQFKYKYNA